MAKLGCLFMVLAMVGLCALIVVPVLPFTSDTSAIDNMLQPLMCDPGERVVREQYQTSGSRGGTVFTMSVACIGENGERDVTDRWMMIGAVGFTLPFLLGLFGFIYGVNRNNRDNSTPTIIVGQAVSAAPVNSLTARLKELQDARDAGMITAEEYERLRQDVLDSNR